MFLSTATLRPSADVSDVWNEEHRVTRRNV